MNFKPKKLDSVHPPPPREKFIKFIGEEYQVVKRGRKEKWTEVIFPLKFEVIGKNIKFGKGEGNFGKEIKI